MRIYLDAAPMIYLVENVEPFKTALVQQLSRQDVELVTSDLSRLECRVKPIRVGNQLLIDAYEQFFREAISQTIPLSAEVIDLATDIRAQFSFATPDAIHLAAPIWANCDQFLTNDHRLQRFDRIQVATVATN